MEADYDVQKKITTLSSFKSYFVKAWIIFKRDSSSKNGLL